MNHLKIYLTNGVGFCASAATSTSATTGTTVMTGVATTKTLTSPVSGITDASTWVNNKKNEIVNCALRKFKINSFY
jgi:hypothetical protein